jgi:rhodanese-related sulfurtransferase
MKREVKMIVKEDLKDVLGSTHDVKILDVRSRGDFEKAHIQGAISLPLSEIEEGSVRMLHKWDFIVTYCTSFDCQASTRAAEKLIALGFSNVVDYKGGIKEYREAGLPIEGAQAGSEQACTSCGNA